MARAGCLQQTVLLVLALPSSVHRGLSAPPAVTVYSPRQQDLVCHLPLRVEGLTKLRSVE